MSWNLVDSTMLVIIMAYMIITEALYDLDIINEEHAHAKIHITRIYFSR